MPTHRGRAVRSTSAGGQATGETPTAQRMRRRALARRTPVARGDVGGIAALKRAFPGNRDRIDDVLHAIRLLRSDRSSKLYTGSKQAFLTSFKETHGVAYPYRVPRRQA